jgi:hypothetical protein
MKSPAKDFRKWMDCRKLKARDVAKRFGVSVQTVGHWRSQGVPERKLPHVDFIIEGWDHPTPHELGSALLLKPTVDQFRAWSHAALAEGAILEEWAIGGLDKLAAEIAAAVLEKQASPDGRRDAFKIVKGSKHRGK